MTISDVLKMIYSLLENPEYDDGCLYTYCKKIDTEKCKRDQKYFNQIAKEWTNKYAKKI